MRKAMLIGVAVAAMASSGCGHSRSEGGGPTVQKQYQVGNFQKVEVAGPFDVTIRTGSGPTVSASGSEKLIERLVVEVKGDTLEIHPERHHGFFNWGWNSVNGQGSVAITVPALSAATLAGSGGISIDKVEGDRFEGQIAGSGDLKVDSVNVKSLKLGIAGSGGAHAMSGKATNAEYKIAGSGDVDARGVATETIKVSIAGAGDVKAQATGAAKVDIMGSGNVDVAGGAKCNVSKMGSGDVTCS
jgi:hypothetical protein